MNPGIWHAPAFPASKGKALYYFIGCDHPREPGRENLAWIPFANNASVSVASQI